MTKRFSNGSPEYYRNLAQFKTEDGLNTAIQSHFYYYSHRFSPSAHAIYTMIKNHAIKYKGVAYLYYKTIMEQCDVSHASVKRAIRLLKKLGVLAVHRTTRLKGDVKGGYGHNVFVILPADLSTDPSGLTHRQESENTDMTSVEASSDAEEAVPCEADTTNNINNNTYQEADEPSSHYSRPYRLFRQAITRYIDASQRTISRMYGVYIAQTKYMRKGGYDDEVLLQTALQAVASTFQATKTKAIRNIPGYFNGVLSKQYDRLYDAVIAELEDGGDDV